MLTDLHNEYKKQQTFWYICKTANTHVGSSRGLYIIENCQIVMKSQRFWELKLSKHCVCLRPIKIDLVVPVT